MKILQVNQYYYPRGGADKYFLDLSLTLKNQGHEVAVFSMQHPNNLDTPWSKYFVSRVSFNKQSIKDKIKTLGRVIYSLEAYNKFTKLLEDFKPDIIHCHNIYHHLSPSILDAARKFEIPVVMHLHDYKLICPNHMLFTKGKYCEECKPHKYCHCLKNICIKNSISGSALASLEMFLHHRVLKIYEKNIAIYIAPSEFMKNKIIEFGQNSKKIEVVYNPHNLSEPGTIISEAVNVTDLSLAELEKVNQDKNIIDNYFLYFGRLSEEKGLNTLIQAAALTKQKVVIAGTGPEEEALKKIARDLKAPVEFIGFKDSFELTRVIKLARAIVIPSIWPENMPLSLMEALSLGKIVIASNIGGLPEIIKNDENGLIFAPGSSSDLAIKINYLNSLPSEMCEALEKAAKDTGEQFSAEDNLNSVINIYQKLLAK